MGQTGTRNPRRERLTKIIRIRMSPSMLDELGEISRRLDRTPSTIIRICVDSVIRPSEATAILVGIIRNMANEIRKEKENE